jgi:hypothetical protein
MRYKGKDFLRKVFRDCLLSLQAKARTVLQLGRPRPHPSTPFLIHYSRIILLLDAMRSKLNKPQNTWQELYCQDSVTSKGQNS